MNQNENRPYPAKLRAGALLIVAGLAGGYLSLRFGLHPVFAILAIMAALYGLLTALPAFSAVADSRKRSMFSAIDESELGPAAGANPEAKAPAAQPSAADAPTEPDSGFCPYCGAPVHSDFAFCRKCGKKLPEA